MNISTTTKLFKNLHSGKIYLGAFIVESDVTHVLYGNEVVEHAMLRTVAGTKTSILGGYLWIDEIFSTGTSNGTIKEHTLTTTLQNSWVKENLEVIVVLWLIDGDTVTAINCQNVPYEPEFNQHEVIKKVDNPITIVPNNNDFYSITFSEQLNKDYKSIEIFSVNGKSIVKTLVSPKTNQAIIDMRNISNGAYIVVVNTNEGKYCKTFIREK